MSSWIPVSEKLPENEQRVLVAVMDGEADPRRYGYTGPGEITRKYSTATFYTLKDGIYGEDRFDADGAFCNCCTGSCSAPLTWLYEVTHWMPIPELPEDENENKTDI